MSLAGQDVDKYQWLEDVSGDRAMAWVKAENARSAKVLESDPRFAGLEAAALKVLESKDRLAMPFQQGSEIYNTWQDAEHVRGILRRTTLTDYLTEDPHWQTILDYDALGKHDKQSWVAKGLICLYPGDDLCLVRLSAGGEDAETLREFSLRTGKFVEGGFVLPKSKQRVSWMDKNTLLVARDWGAGAMTKSGYAFVVKQWRRGEPLDQAKEIYRGTENDVNAGAYTLHDSAGHHAVIFVRGVDFFRTEVSLLTPSGPRKLELPGKTDIGGLLDGQFIVTLNENWGAFAQGSVVSMDLAAITKDPEHLKPTAVFTPTPIEFVQDISTTRTYLVVRTLENVKGRAYIISIFGR